MAAKDISLVGATFYSVPQVDLPISGGGTASFVEISDTTATAADVASGKYFYTSAGVKTEGTASGGGGDPWSWLGKNPTKVQTFDGSAVYLKDTNFNTWTPSTSAANCVASTTKEYSSPDFANYDYVILSRLYTHIEYTGTPSGAKAKNNFYAAYADAFGYEANYNAITAGTVTNYSSLAGTYANGLYYLTSSGSNSYAVASYGIYCNTALTLTVTSSKITITVPAIQMRCNSTYFSTTAAGAVDKNNSYLVRPVEVWRVDRGTSNGGARYAIIRDMFLNGIS